MTSKRTKRKVAELFFALKEAIDARKAREEEQRKTPTPGMGMGVAPTLPGGEET
jgi:hypothetical protein